MKLNVDEKLSNSDRRKGLILPKHMSKELAELMGILSGDGYIGEYKNSQGYTGRKIEVCGHSEHDRLYLCNHVSKLFRDIFGLETKARYHKGQNTMVIALESPGLFFFLKSLGMNTGPKTDISIPNAVLSDRKFLIPFIRGLFDTDGCVSLKKRHKSCHYYPTISFGQKSTTIMKQVESSLKDMGFDVYVQYNFPVDLGTGKKYYGNKLDINGKDALEMWMKLIGFNNQKHLSKVSKCLSFYRNGKIKDYCKRNNGVDENRTRNPSMYDTTGKPV
jgi:hypothetical protein